MKKAIISICIAAIAMLMVSTATAVPVANSESVEKMTENEKTGVPVEEGLLDTLMELLSYLGDSAIALIGVLIAPFYGLFLIVSQLPAFVISLVTEFINGLMEIFSGEPSL